MTPLHRRTFLAAAIAAAYGAYDDPGGLMLANIADLAGADTHVVAVPLGLTNDQATRWGFQFGVNRVAVGAFNPTIVQGPVRRNNVAANTAVQVGILPAGIALGPRSIVGTAAALAAMIAGIPATSNFVTNGIYRTANARAAHPDR